MKLKQIALLVAPALCAIPGAAQERLTMAPCTLPGMQEPVRCGTHRVYENRAARAGRLLGLRVVVAPARAANPAPDPVWVLAGGPGQGAAELAPQLLRELEGLRATRDVVLVDQRGTGASNKLDCAGGFGVLEEGRGAELRACRVELERRADLRHYSTVPAMDDMNEVRAALGYDVVNLVGISYGTRAAQVFMRRHPSRVRTAILRAVSPLGGNILVDGTRTADRELERVLADCEADAACSGAFPTLRAELDSLIERVHRSPARVRPPGAAEEIKVTRALVVQTLYALMLSASTRQRIPLVIHRAATEGLQPVAAIIGQVRAASYGTVPVGMYLTVICSEDEPRMVSGVAASGRMRATLAGIHDVCAAWPRAKVPAAFHAPLRTRTPVLLISGAADPATGVEAADAWARTLPNAHHAVFSATTHSPAFPGCGTAMVKKVIESRSVVGLERACTSELRWPPFTLPR